jgi:iron complex transport system substrate-binding protein
VFSPEESDVLIRPGPRMAEAARLMAACLERHAGGAPTKAQRAGAQ